MCHYSQKKKKFKIINFVKAILIEIVIIDKVINYVWFIIIYNYRSNKFIINFKMILSISYFILLFKYYFMWCIYSQYLVS